MRLIYNRKKALILILIMLLPWWATASWRPISSGGAGTPGGADTQVQFNDGGSFAGDADLTWNKTTNLLTSAGSVKAPFFYNAADPADAGVLRLGNGECIESEASPAGTDMSICSDTSERWVFSTPISGSSGTVALPAISVQNGQSVPGFYYGTSPIGYLGLSVSGTAASSYGFFGTEMHMPSTTNIGFCSTAISECSALDTQLGRDGAAGAFKMADAASATPTAYTLRIGSSSRGGTDSNVAGANGTIKSGTGTGTGAVANLTFQTPNLGSSGSTAQTYGTRLILNQPCTDSAGDAACGAATSGNFVIDAADTNTVVSTTNVTAGSQIFIMEDSSLGTLLGVTCNTTIARTYAVTARTAATSFTVTASAAPTTNPACLSYFIIN